MPDSMRDLRLPLELCQAAEQKFAARFGSLEQFLAFVLQELVRDDAAQMDQAEQRVIEKRLRDLGYI
jgi:hypothetical protein